MNIQKQILLALLALFIAGGLQLASKVVHAQQSAASITAPRISGFDEGGGTQTVSYPDEPRFRLGDKVKVENSTLVLDQ